MQEILGLITISVVAINSIVIYEAWKEDGNMCLLILAFLNTFLVLWLFGHLINLCKQKEKNNEKR
ncbi:hypothetical protein [uncultured Veillonella sp.]|uniref:hypothetical protein n=1 Tax=uncultured Veillonella sp. TaxID=159268 RepID=UPI002599D304|nr:hypothetical protein [uncultured Veillonella sp.]